MPPPVPLPRPAIPGPPEKGRFLASGSPYWSILSLGASAVIVGTTGSTGCGCAGTGGTNGFAANFGVVPLLTGSGCFCPPPPPPPPTFSLGGGLYSFRNGATSVTCSLMAVCTVLLLKITKAASTASTSNPIAPRNESLPCL